MIIENSKDCPSCGSNHKSKPFCIYEDGYHCFSCGVTKRGDRGFTVSSQSVSNDICKEFFNPIRTFNNFSLEIKEYLTKFYITELHVHKNNLFTINEHDKNWIIYPTVEDNQIVFYQKRCISERILASSGAKVSAISVQKSDTVVIVEDFISYCRVSEFADCICLFGTSLNNKDAQYVIDKYDDIKVWLDNDHMKTVNSGQMAAKKICKALEYLLYLKNVKRGFTICDSRITNVVTEQDPKYYSDTEIKQILGGYYVLSVEK